jgi:tetratricopeptide (TPR) repeat protein
MRSRKNSRQTAATAGVRAQNEQSATSAEEAPVQADAFTPDAAVSVAPTQAASPDGADVASFDTSVEGPDAQLATPAADAEATAEAEAEPAVDPELGLDAKQLLSYLRQRVLDNASDVAARIRLGQLHDKRSEPLLALEQYQAAVNAEPDNAAVVLQFAQALTALNRFAEAERELRRVLRAEPDNGQLHLQLGTISFRRGLYSQAELELKRAIELLPDAAYAYFHRGESLNQLSRIDEALDMLERGVALDPTYSRAYYIMGILYDRKSRPQEAGAMYKKAREVSGT